MLAFDVQNALNHLNIFVLAAQMPVNSSAWKFKIYLFSNPFHWFGMLAFNESVCPTVGISLAWWKNIIIALAQAHTLTMTMHFLFDYIMKLSPKLHIQPTKRPISNSLKASTGFVFLSLLLNLRYLLPSHLKIKIKRRDRI